MQKQIDTLIEDIKKDYVKWQEACCGKNRAVNQRMIEEFNDGFSVAEGSKYIKILKSGSVWGFIVKGDNDKKFRKGDILKPAGWATPARNKARGNILDGEYSISWTGPNYLRQDKMKKVRTLQKPKQRNFYAAAVHDPSSPFRPKTIPNKRDEKLFRKRKHKGKYDDEAT